MTIRQGVWQQAGMISTGAGAQRLWNKEADGERQGQKLGKVWALQTQSLYPEVIPPLTRPYLVPKEARG